MDEEERHTPPFPMKQIKAKKAREQRDGLKEKDNQKEERMGGDGERQRKNRDGQPKVLQ